MESGQVRIDKWLWAVRLYKSRQLASLACQAGAVKVGGQVVKPSRAIRPGDLVDAKTGDLLRTVRVLGITDKRVGPKGVAQYIEDLTPESRYEESRARKAASLGRKHADQGRPTKQERRAVEHFWNQKRGLEG